MLTQFRIRYPQGSLMSELVTIDHGQYIVRALVQVDGVILATGLAAADSVEQAEDTARTRALTVLDLNATAATVPEVKLQDNKIPADKKTTQPNPKVSSTTQKSREAEPLSSSPDTEPNSLKALLSDLPEIREATPFASSEPESNNQSPAPATTHSQTNGLSLEERLAKTTPESDIPLPIEEMPLQPSFDELSEQPATATVSTLSATDAIDFSDIIARSNVELKRLGWTSEQGRNYLLQTYGKRSRQLLSDEELLEFLQYLESQPNP